MKKMIKSGDIIMTKDYKIETQAIHAAQTIDETGHALFLYTKQQLMFLMM